MFSYFRLNVFLLISLLFSISSSYAYSVPRNSIFDISIGDGPGSTLVPRNQLTARANPTVCANLTINETKSGVYVATIRVSTCYCVVGGSLTTASSADYDRAFATGSTAINQTALSEYASSNGLTRAQAVSGIKSGVVSAMNGKTSTCTYPANSEPACGDTCPFTCASGYKACGTTTCIASTATCASGVKKRDSSKLCPAGWEACGTGLTSFGSISDGWECVNTSKDIESCGGCQQPMPGNKVGVDCTAIAGANGVACVSGECQIASCIKGYNLVDNACIRTTSNRSWTAKQTSSSTSKYWTEQLKPVAREKVYPKRTRIATASPRTAGAGL